MLLFSTHSYFAYLHLGGFKLRRSTTDIQVLKFMPPDPATIFLGYMMGEHALISLDFENFQSLVSQGIEWETLSIFGRIKIDVSPKTYDNANFFIRSHFGNVRFYCDVTALDSVLDVISLLDNGAAMIFISRSQLDEIMEKEMLADTDRLIVCVDSSQTGQDDVGAIKSIQEKLRSSGRPIKSFQLMEFDSKSSTSTRGFEEASGELSTFYVALAKNALDEYKHIVQSGFTPIVAAQGLTAEPAKYSSFTPIHRLITGILRSDRSDGLYPTVVTDEDGVCLGLVYSNEESVQTALRLRRGVYHSRSRKGLWIKGEESGDFQQLVSIEWDCDGDALRFMVRQQGGGKHGPQSCRDLSPLTKVGFCHLKRATCFGPYSGLSRLKKTLKNRKISAPEGSYTARLFNDPKLLEAKIMEEASELCEASSKAEIAAEAADLFYFALAKCIAADVTLEDVGYNLDYKSLKTVRRKGDAKKQWAEQVSTRENKSVPGTASNQVGRQQTINEASSRPKSPQDPAGTIIGMIRMRRFKVQDTDSETLERALQRPSQRSTAEIMRMVSPIIDDVRQNGDSAVLNYTHKFEKATSLTSPVLKAPFGPELMHLAPETAEAIDISYENIRRFHEAQLDKKPLVVETMPGVVCSRFSRPIERVGLYVPGGTAVLPSTALMLGIPAMVAGCKQIVIASPPRSNGTITPEIVYVAHKVGAESIVLAGGAQAVAAMAYGTESISKVDKILGPGNQFVTTGKMIVSNDTSAAVSIDMPAGPSEVLVIADETANPSFVASDLLSQAEHGTDSQVVLIAVNLEEAQLAAIEAELLKQAEALPRVDIVRGAIEHSTTLMVDNIVEALNLSNRYAPEHLILQVDKAETLIPLIQNAGSVFIGHWTPESVGDYSAGVNHSLRKSTLYPIHFHLITPLSLPAHFFPSARWVATALC